MIEEIDLDNLNIKIRKSTPKYHRVAKIWVEKETAKIEITEQERWFDIDEISSVLNHEFLHWIVSIMSKPSPKKYDNFLKACGVYYHEILMETKQ